MKYKVLNNSDDKIKLIVPKDISHLLGETILLKRRDEFILDWLPENKDTRLIIKPIIKQEEPKKQRLLVSEFKQPELKKDIKTKGGRS